MTNFVPSDSLCQAVPYSGENNVGGLNKTKLVFWGVVTGFIMEM